MNRFKTVALLAALTVLFIYLGELLGGRAGMIIALIFAGIMNFVSLWLSDSIVLAMYRAREIPREEAPWLHEIVEELAASAGIPKPRIYLVPMEAPNAFATGRSPSKAAVAVTSGLLKLLDEREIRGVLSHEIAHIKNRDTLIQAVAATLAGAIMMLARMAYFASWFGFGRDDEGPNLIELLVLLILAPIAAILIQLAISRSREYLADETGARISRDPLSLASALEKLYYYSRRIPADVSPATTHLFIVTPRLKGNTLASLFSTHPPIEERIERLRRMALQM